MIDDEAAGRAEAVGSEVGAVAVAGEDEQAGALGGGHDFPFGAADALAAGARAPQSLGCGVEELPGGDGGEVLQPGAGVALGACAAEQPGVGAAGGAGNLGPGDVQQRDFGVVGREVRAAPTQAGQVPSTIQAMTMVTVISLR